MVRAAQLLAFALSLFIMAAQAFAPQDAQRADLQRRAEAGDAQAQVTLGRALQGDAKPENKTAGVEWYRKAAVQGSAEGAWLLGSAYMAGAGMARDVPNAIEWMRKSVTLDHNPDHMAVLAVALLATGSAPEALKWAQEAADKGAPKGMELVAMAHLSGEMGLPKDIAAGEQWLLKAAQKGDPDAQLSLGQFYVSGMFGRQDPAAAVRWLQAAVDGGSARAAGTLAYFLITGKDGVPVDAARGVTLARKAIASNDMLGHYAMGVAYVTGSGVAENPAEGWYQISLAQRMDSQQQLKTAGDYLAKAAAKLSTTQLTALKARVDADAAKVATPSGT
ncbi:sel1 repeat family protein [Dyella solisilvae]|uniref:Sel1 repeat family protein n=1 Tax=Dyella solisilvae TaxID=1920168 RepID=A0A370KCL0_9GAMM|nr:tetratricopeptide repeat protein [Dyella solisilvae]RDJ00385.1 sel1 repeat family protein [Dyella solisilvae]